MSMKLYVGNLSFSTSDADLNDIFTEAGTIESARIITDRDTGQSRGFGFVEMSSRSEGEAAITAINGKEINGRILKVTEAKPQESRSDNRRSSGNRNNSYRSGSRY